MKLVGVDLSTDPNKTGVCTLDEGRICASLCRGPSDQHTERLLKRCSDAYVVAVDVPFGWPKPFIEALAGYHIGVPFDLPRKQYQLRTTDLWVKDNFPPLQPKSVSTDKLGSTAIAGTNLLHALSKNGFRLSPQEVSVYAAVIEVYPAASLRAWDLRDYTKDETLRRLQEEFGLAIDETTKQELLGNVHCFDALIATLTAREYASGSTFDPPEDILRTEGWIRIPSRTVQ